MNNREAANLIVQEICTTLMQLPSEKDWKKLVDFAERKIEATQQDDQEYCTCYKPMLELNGVTSTTCIRCGKPPKKGR